MVKRRFQSSVNIAKTRSFPGADIGSGHKLVMMTFKLLLQRANNRAAQGSDSVWRNSRTPPSQNIFQAMIGQFAPLLALENQDTEIDVLINSFNTVVTETVNNTLANTDQPWVMDNILKGVRQTERNETQEEYD